MIPAYNHADYLDEALSSVYSSLNVNVEVLVVDDGSTDHTELIVQKFPQARYLKQENQGSFAAINTGVSLCSNEKIAILNDDDMYTPHYLSHALKLQSFTRADLVATSPTIIGFGDKLRRLVIHQQAAVDKINEYGPLLSLLSINWFVSTSGLVFNRSLFDSIGGFRELDMHSDIDFVLRAAFSSSFQFASNLDGSWSYRCHNTNSGSRIDSKLAASEIPFILQVPLLELSKQGLGKNEVLKLLGHGLTKIEKLQILEDYKESQY